MVPDKKTVFQYFKKEIPSGALSRTDNGSIYIFMKENTFAGEKNNLLIFDGANKPQKAIYHLFESDGAYFIQINDTFYELQLPDKISDEEAFTMTIKSADGTLISFENYI